MRVKIMIFSIICSVCFIMSGCKKTENLSGKDDQEKKNATETTNQVKKEEEGTSSNGKVEIRFSWWGSEARHEATLKAIEAYETENQNVKITPEYSGYDGYQDKLMAQVAGGNAPDIFTDVSEWFPTLYEANAMSDMTNAFDMSGHSQAMIDACSYRGKVCGVNTSLNGYGIFYNKTIAEKYGINIPDGDYTWDDLMKICQEVYTKSEGKVYGMVDPRSTATAINAYCFTALQKPDPFPWSNEALTITADDFCAYQKFLQDQPEGVLLPPDESFTAEDFSSSAIAQGVAFCTYQSIAMFDSVQSQTDDDMSIMLLPKGPQGESANTSRPGLILSIYEGSKVKEEAAKFLDWFTNSEEAAKILKLCRGVLPTEKQRLAVTTEADLLSTNDLMMNEIIDKIFQGEFREFLPGPVGANEVMEVTQINIGQEVAFGTLDVEDSGEKFMQEALKVLQR